MPFLISMGEGVPLGPVPDYGADRGRDWSAGPRGFANARAAARSVPARRRPYSASPKRSANSVGQPVDDGLGVGPVGRDQQGRARQRRQHDDLHHALGVGVDGLLPVGRRLVDRHRADANWLAVSTTCMAGRACSPLALQDDDLGGTRWAWVSNAKGRNAKCGMNNRSRKTGLTTCHSSSFCTLHSALGIFFTSPRPPRRAGRRCRPGCRPGGGTGGTCPAAGC